MRALTVIDDDPTGAQGEAGVPLLLEWPDDVLDRAAADPAGAIHLLTNSRALGEADAYRVVRDAVQAAVQRLPGRRLTLRGDSTLRAHVLAEYSAVRDGAFPGREPPHVLIPALPAAGRVTVDGVHWLIRDGSRIPLAATEYADDSAFAYTTSRLLDWAQERSSGYFRAADGRELHLDRLRAPDGAGTVAETLAVIAAAGRPAVFAPDAETVADLQTIAEGIDAAERQGVDAIVRCAPAFVGVASGTAATASAEMPRTRRVLVVVGSHVPTTTRQLDRLIEAQPGSLIEVDPALLVSAAAAEHVDAAVAAARARLSAHGLAVVATQRTTPRELLTQETGLQIARGLARILAGARADGDVVVSKGGITSAVLAHDGLGANEALVIGPVAPGISLWRVSTASGPADLIVFPGNVGDDDALAGLVDQLTAV